MSKKLPYPYNIVAEEAETRERVAIQKEVASLRKLVEIQEKIIARLESNYFQDMMQKILEIQSKRRK